jgi:hypothetical protein
MFFTPLAIARKSPMKVAWTIAGLVLCLFFGFPLVTVALESKADITCTISRPAVPQSISPSIYGLAAPSLPTVTNWNVPLIRWGGNTAECYNWQLGNAWNTGKDWFFENVAIEPHAWQNFLARGEGAGTRVFLNLPLIGYVAKDSTSHSFSIKKYGPQQQHDPSRPDAGNGVRSDGALVVGNDRADSAVVANPEFVAAWVRAMKTQFPKPFAERRVIFALGNEPMLWNLAHRDVHPDPISYDEYLSRFVNLAKAVKTAAPEAEIAGPELWGWPAYFQSAQDRDRKSEDDRRRHGGEDFLPWFLGRMREQERQGGVRLLDYVTVHFYPQAQGVFSPDVDPAATKLRLETVRSLWDATYQDPSWIQAKVELLPRLKRWVAAAYPGTKIGLTEYNWGGEEDISGALALADILGTFGREGLDLACYWSTPAEGSFAAAAYALYRNTDGAGAHFGGEALLTSWEGGLPENLSVYAAMDRAARAATVIVVNKSGLPRSLRLRWQGVDVSAGPGYVVDGSAPRIAATTKSVSPLQPISIAARSAVHVRFVLK